jgi:restriction system protein
MSLWLVRAGRHGEYEERFFGEGRIYLTWYIPADMTGTKGKRDVKPLVVAAEKGASAAKVANHTGQIWAFLGRMKPGDLIATPRKHKASIAIGELVGACEYDAKADVLFRHSRRVKWLRTDVPRAAFDQDILYSFGAIQTICEVARNDAEQRVRTMIAAGWKMKTSLSPPVVDEDGDGESEGVVDLERTARDQIAQLISQRFKGHELTHLIAAVLQAKGFRTFVSPPGPDKGIDILAAPEPLGFGRPRICVQVKSSDTPVDRPTLDQLLGVMQNTQAEQGLLVSWGGFKQSVDKEEGTQFFRVRLWDADDVVDAILAEYDRLPEALRALLPLKRVWVVALDDDDED